MTEPSPPAPRDLPFAIDLRRVHLAVGWIAFGLPLALLGLTFLPQVCFYGSISHFYFSPVGGDLFVGMLSFIGLLLLFLYSFKAPGYDGALGWHWYDVLAIRLAGLAALVVAFVPASGSGCVFGDGTVPRAFVQGAAGAEDFPVAAPPGEETPVSGTPSFDFPQTVFAQGPDSWLAAAHYIAAGVMFLILAYVVLVVFTRVNSDAALAPGNRKELRNRCYRGLGLVILAVVAVLFVKMLAVRDPSPVLKFWNTAHLTFAFEAMGLLAFGLAWMIKGRFLRAFEDRAAARQDRAA